MKFRSPFGVTIVMKMVIFMKLMKHGHENPGGALGAEKCLLAGTCSKNNDLPGAWVRQTGSSGFSATPPAQPKKPIRHDL